MTDVHVYRDDPRCREITRPATSSITMMQKLETKTVAWGIQGALEDNRHLFPSPVAGPTIIAKRGKPGHRGWCLR
jgi:hypothetical protein